MEQVRTAYNGLKYMHGVVIEKPRTVTRIVLWKIPHNDPDKVDISLKIGRYTKLRGTIGYTPDMVETGCGSNLM